MMIATKRHKKAQKIDKTTYLCAGRGNNQFNYYNKREWGKGEKGAVEIKFPFLYAFWDNSLKLTVNSGPGWFFTFCPDGVKIYLN
jgi:hypothetical protein